MPRGFAFAAVLLLLSAAARAQSDAELIAQATLPLPPQLKHDAEVVVTGPDGRQRVIRAGRTALTCTPDDPSLVSA